jgi:hypothetical protein
MSIGTSFIAVASIAALATTALAPTSASASWAGARLHPFAGRLHSISWACGAGGGCNMKW